MTPYVQLFGAAKVQLEAESVPFLSDKRFVLLAYLAYKADWVSRDQLAFLFWNDTSTQGARKNLRHLLSRVRALPFAKFESEDERVRWRVNTDVAQFQQFLGQGDWEHAIQVYKGRLLENMDPGLMDDDEWLRQEQEGLHSAYREAALNHSQQLEAQDRFEEASALLARVLKEDALAEDIVQAYLRTAHQSGQRVEALKAFEAFKTMLKQELGLEALEGTKQLAEALQHEPPPRQRTPPAPTPAPTPETSPSVLVEEAPKLRNLPAQLTTFVGRDVDLSEIAGFFKAPNIRLLTLIGPGGMGKTRLAMQVAIEQVKQFQDGVTFVPLASIAKPENITPTIASALELPFTTTDSPDEQLKTHLQDKDMLLILDNLEHVIAGAGIILELLEACPRLKILTTSREALDFHGEYLVEVHGMDVPKTGQTEHIEMYDAVQLFLRSARRVNPRFVIEPDAKPHVAQICQMLHGSPLAIELATNWMRLLSVKEVAEEIQKSLNFLQANQPDLPERHRSLRAVFEHSWNLLTEDEQAALKRLSVFNGGFRKEAAEAVSGVALRTLFTLTNKSLLQRTPTGRFERHAMVREFSQEKLAQDQRLFVDQQEKHGVYFFDALAQRPMNGPNDQQYLREIEEDLENIRTAWHWAVMNKRADQLERSTDLVVFYDRKARSEEGSRLFQEAITGLDDGDTTHHAALGMACLNTAWLYHRLGRYEQAQQLAMRAVELLRPLENSAGGSLMKALNTLGMIEKKIGNDEWALKNFKEALILARKNENNSAIATYLDNIGNIESKLGHMKNAEVHYIEALKIHKSTKDDFGSVIQLNNLGLLKCELNELEEAADFLHEGLKIARKIGFAVIIPYFLSNLGNLALKMNDLEAAQGWCYAALHEIEQQANLTIKATALMTLGKISTAMIAAFEANKCFCQSLEIAWKIRELPIVMQNLIGLAELNLKLGKSSQAYELLRIVLHHPATEAVSRREAAELFKQLPDSVHLPPPAKDVIPQILKHAVMNILENPVTS